MISKFCKYHKSHWTVSHLLIVKCLATQVFPVKLVLSALSSRTQAVHFSLSELWSVLSVARFLLARQTSDASWEAPIRTINKTMKDKHSKFYFTGTAIICCMSNKTHAHQCLELLRWTRNNETYNSANVINSQQQLRQLQWTLATRGSPSKLKVLTWDMQSKIPVQQTSKHLDSSYSE